MNDFQCLIIIFTKRENAIEEISEPDTVLVVHDRLSTISDAYYAESGEENSLSSEIQFYNDQAVKLRPVVTATNQFARFF